MIGLVLQTTLLPQLLDQSSQWGIGIFVEIELPEKYSRLHRSVIGRLKKLKQSLLKS